MTITFEEATTVQTAEEIEAERLDELAAEGVSEQGYGDHTVPRTMVTLESRGEARAQDIRATVIRAAFGDTAATLPTSWVDKKVEGHYNEVRLPAVAAVHRCKLVLGGTVPAYNNVEPGEMVVQTADGALQFESVDEISISNGETKYYLFRCRAAGVDGNVAPGSITRFATSFPGLTVTNDTGSLVTVGRPAEANEAYIERGRAKMALPAAGASALSYVTWTHDAFEAAGVEDTITQVRVDDTNRFGPGTVAVYLANAAGGATQDELDVATPYLLAHHPSGAGRLYVLAADTLAISVAGVIYAATNPSVLTDAGTVLAQYQVEAQGASEVLLSELIKRLRLIAGCTDVALTSPAANVSLDPSLVPVFTNELEEGAS